MKQNTQHWISGLTSFFISTPKDGYFHFIWVFIGYSLKIIVFYIQTFIETQNGAHLQLV